jgi:hypothetical protein
MPLVKGGYPPTSTDYLFAGLLPADVSHAPRFNMPITDASSDTAVLTTQVMTAVALPLCAGDVVTKLCFKSGATAAGTPTNWWFALYDTAATPNLIAQTADQLTATWAADTAKDLALSAPFTAPAPGLYYAAVMVKATTPPSLIGVTLGRASAASGFLSTDKVIVGTSGSALTTTAPATLAALTAIAACPRVVAH